MDWDDLRFVVAVADKGSAVAAAQSLSVNATTVQRRILRFEKTNNVHLFERRQSGFKPTPECEALVEASRSIEESVSAIKREILSRDIRLEGRLAVTTVDTLMDDHMAGHLAEFQKLHPNIKVEITLTNSRLDLSRQDADVAIRPSNNPPEHLIGHMVGKLPIAVYGSASFSADFNLDKKGCSFDPALILLPWVGTGNALGGSPVGSWIEHNIAASSVVLTVDTFNGIARAVAAGCGIGLLPCSIGDRNSGLVQLSRPLDELSTSIWLLTHKEIRTSAKIRAFMQFMAKALRSDISQFAGESHR